MTLTKALLADVLFAHIGMNQRAATMNVGRLDEVASLAWVGLVADALSSSRYAPEQAFLALGAHTDLALYMAIATAFTGFVIAVASSVPGHQSSAPRRKMKPTLK